MINEIEITFKERERFIESLADQNIYGWVCPVHNVVIGKRHAKCPLCESEEKSKLNVKEIKDKGLLVGTKTLEDISKARDIKREKAREYFKKRLQDPELKEKHYEAVKKYNKKERLRKKEHSLLTDNN